MTKSELRSKLRQERELQGLCVHCGKHKPKSGAKGCAKCLKKNVEINGRYAKNNHDRIFAYYQKVRVEVIEKYGGKCVCCGEENKFFLAVDHKNDDGGEERKSLYGSQNGASRSWYLKLRRELIREDLQILCHNCNMAKSLYGMCPHNPNFIHPNFGLLEVDGRRKGNFGIGCKIDWPSDEELLRLVNETSCSQVARDLGVDNTAVRGRMQRRGLYSMVKLRTGKNKHGSQTSNQEVIP